MGADEQSEDIAPPEAKDILAIERTDYFKIGLALTLAILLIAGTYFVVEFDAIYAMKPNEFGDFLAGIFGPLVLLWVVMGFLQQGAELKYSREALLLQAKELKASVEAQKDMGAAAWASVHAEQEAQKRLQQDAERSIRPILVLQATNLVYGRRSSLNKSHYIEIHNSGKACFGIALSVDDGNLKLSKNHITKLETGETETISLNSRKAYQYSDTNIIAYYRDIEGSTYVRRYELISLLGERLHIPDEFGVDHPLDPTPIPR
jgi:hypothetical protein